MRRLHLFEVHDSVFCPAAIRNGLTDFLEISTDVFDTYGIVRTRVVELLASSGVRDVVDLCSGAGGPWVHWLKKGLVSARVTLTDKFPNGRARGSLIESEVPGLVYRSEPVDAAEVPPELTGFRTIFTAFHHFRPERARAIIADAVSKRQPIGIFELTSRCPKAFLCMLLSPLGVWLLTPRMRRIGWSKLIFTYLIPLIPICVLIDGITSCFRTYSVEELAAMVSDTTYIWTVGELKGKGAPITYLVGYPQQNKEAAGVEYN
ncbi:MAG TPA: hypothetical protein VLI55_13585 [Bryobacteraceae bacterium]|nr:hypothetical protein [Bryobacteraceae bacterium]